MALCVRLCLFVLFAYVIVSTSVVEGRNLRRRHGHHFYPDYYQNFEESVPRKLSKRLEDDLEYFYRKQTERRELSGVVNRPAEYKERISPLRRYTHMYDLTTNYDEPLRRKDETHRQEHLSEDTLMKSVVRGKRHNRRDSTVRYQNFETDQDRKEMSRQDLEENEPLFTSPNDGLRASFEMEVKEAQNSSICNYSVESIPDIRGTRMPRDLEHIKCNHVGSKCQHTNHDYYCCIQTFRYVHVSYSDGGDSERIKLYVGCVCALQGLKHEVPLMETKLRTDD